ncbi:PREDICTED: protein FAM111A [Dipodomys ordii]|uniref:Protein FAM111A n=1 Tax=Dipodomys ordii TaxID=10020 RepID=A0A1S3G8P0_DIPOR|nr:PREDICTED: protein FAM111A [Dipodomys ordii]XP_012884401.1 PREDICTED: protein FAM111A [Dipodomys ordii]XP_012884402.1 PREDICTED: protein FAM111A [Dipodomys ordii]
MSSKKRKSQKITFDARNNMKIKHYFPQKPKEEQNSPSTSQMKVESRKRPSDITNTIEQTSHLPKSKPQDLTATPKKKIEITFDVNIRKHKNMKYTLIHDEKESLYKGLVTLDAVKTEIDARPGQEMLVCGTKGIEGYLNLGMPLHCFPEKNHVEITFFKSSYEQKEYKQMSGRYDHASTECVKFYVHAIGKRVKEIVRCRKLHKEGSKLCVFGFKGETIKDTLCKDGRFCALIEKESWRLIGDLDSIIESTQPVDELEGQLFQVEVERKAKRKVTAPAPNLEPEEKVLKEYIVKEYPSLRSESKKIREYIKEKAEQRKKGKKTSLFTLHRRNFGKLTKNATLVKVHKFLSQLGDSVGFLLWDNNGNMGCATCFVFSGPFILTCRHVINDIVGKGIEPSQWADIIGQCVKVIFNYEEVPVKEENCFFLEPWFQISDGTLDYAVLKLKADGQPVPLGLRDKIAPLPLNGLMYIIGHPQGESKRTDGCAVIPQSEREQKYKENIQAGEAVGCNFPPHFVYMHTQNSFQKIAHNPDVLTYDTTFYWGSSGSPVFDSQGSLVAMHTAGITCEYQHGILNIIEFGSSMESILSDMKQKDEAWYNEVCVQPQDVEMLSQDY